MNVGYLVLLVLCIILVIGAMYYLDAIPYGSMNAIGTYANLV